VAEGPKTEAARQKILERYAKEAAAIEKAPAVQGEKAVAPKENVSTEVKTTVKATTGSSKAFRTTAKAGGGVLAVIMVGAAVKDTVTQYQEGNYKGAAKTAGLTVASFTPLRGVVMAYGAYEKYQSDKTIGARSFEVGDKVLEKTGSPVLGGIASAGAAVGIAGYETGKDMYNSAVDFVDWGLTKMFFDD
jgi:hypothetical protein